MENQPSKQAMTGEAAFPTPLADDQIAQVAGGGFLLSLGGCPGCMSGFATAFQSLSFAVNPANFAVNKSVNVAGL
jgi:hypothetical protein